MSNKASKRVRQEVKPLKWNLRPSDSLEDLAKECNAKIRGWVNYYGHYCYSSLYKIVDYIDYRLMLWASHQFKRVKGRLQRAKAWLNEVRERDPTLFVHWERMNSG